MKRYSYKIFVLMSILILTLLAHQNNIYAQANSIYSTNQDTTVNTGGTFYYCDTDPADILNGIQPANKEFVGPGINDPNPTDGIATFTPIDAGVGSHTVTYSGKPYTFVVTTAAVATLDPIAPTEYCETDAAFALTGGLPVDPTGTYYVNGVVRTDFDPTVEGPGSHSVTYSVGAGGCISYSAPQILVVYAMPAVTLNPFADMCEGDASIVLTGGSPLGGTYSGTGVAGGLFDPAVAGIGTHTITYSYTNASGTCTDFDTEPITVNALPVVSFAGLNATYCSDDLPVVDGVIGSPIPGGGETGIFTGLGISNTGVGTGTFDPGVAGLGTHTITYTFTDANSCSDSYSQDTDVGTVLTMAGIASPYCVNDPIFTVVCTPGGGTFTPIPGILNDNGDGTADFDPNTVGSYTIEYEYDDGTCINKISQTADVLALPIPAIAGLAATYCTNDAAVTLTGSPTDANGVFSGPGITDNGDGTASFNPATPGAGGPYTITYTYTNAAGCSEATTEQTTVLAIPTATIIGDATICSGDLTPIDITLTGTAPYDFTYTDGITPTNIVGNATDNYNTNVSPASTRTYTVTTVTDNTGCSNTGTGSAVITVNPRPTAEAGLSETMCFGAGTTLNGSAIGGTGSYTYLWSNGAAVASVAVNPVTLGANVYTLTVTDAGNSCTDTDNVTITVVDNPTVTASSNISASCTGGDVILSAVGAGGTGLGTYTYDWGVGFGSPLTVNPTNPIPGSAPTLETYTVTVEDGNNCTGTDQVSVTVNSHADINIANDNQIYCQDPGNITLSATPVGGTWSDVSTAGFIVGADEFDPTAQSGFHTVEYEYIDGASGGCTTTEQATVEILPYATPNITDIDIQNEPLFCSTDAGPYTVQGVMTPDIAGQPGVVESFSGNGITDNGDGTADFDPSAAGIGVHTITYTVTTPGCSNTFTEDVRVGIPVTYNNPTKMCVGDADVTLVADNVNGEWTLTFVDDATSTTSVMGPYTHVSMSAVLQATEAGTYTINYELTDGNVNCTPDVTVVVYDLPTVNFTIDGNAHTDLDINFCDNDASVSLLGNNAFNNIFSGAGVTGNQFDPTTGFGTYYITYTHTDINGCAASVTSEAVTVNAAPVISIDGLNATKSYCKDELTFTITGNPTNGAGGVAGTYNFPASWTSGTEYTWPTALDGVAQINPSVVDPTGSFSIDYQVTDLNGCVGTITEIIDINPLPTVDFGGLPVSGQICQNASAVTLTGSPTDNNGSFSGDGITNTLPLDGTATFDPNGLALGTYTITYTYTDPVTSCVNSIQKNIEVIAIPTQYSITAPGGDEYCEGDVGVKLGGSNAEAGISYELIRNGVTSVETMFPGAGAFTFLGDNTAGVYTIEASNASGCSVTYNNTITVVEVPAIDDAGAISGNTNICADGITAYTYTVPAITNATDYVWNLPAGVTLDVDAGNTIDVIFDVAYVTGTIEVYGIDPANSACPDGVSSTLTVDARDLPNDLGAAITGDNVICEGETGKTYSVDAALFNFETSFEWQTTVGTITSDPTVANVVVDFPAGAVSGILSVRAVNACGTTAWVDYAITVNPTPNVSISPLGAGDLIDCSAGSQVQLTANSTENPGDITAWTWTASNGGTILAGDESVQNPRVTHEGDFQVQIEVTTNGQACFNTATISVGADKTAPIISIDPPTELDCNNTSIFLQGNSNAVNSDYNWTFTPPANIVGSTNTDNPEVDAPGTYTLTVTNLDNSCESTVAVLVSENITAPNISVTTPATNTITCLDPTVQVTGSSTTLGATYQWTTAIVGATITTPTNNTTDVDMGGDYDLTVTDPANGCTSTLTVTVNENTNPPTITSLLNNDVPANLSCDNLTAQLEAQAAADPTATFAWSTTTGTIDGTSGGNNQFAVISAPADYSVVATDPANGCTSAPSTITVIEDLTAPTISITSAITELDCNNTSIDIDASATINADTWTWTFTAGGNILAGQGTNTITVDAPATYTLTAENSTTGCTSTSDYIITQDIAAPNVSINVGTYEITCAVPTETINATGDADPLTTYLWTGPSIVGPATGLNVSVDQPGDYTITATATNGCTASATETVADNTATPDITLAPVLDLTCTQTTVQISGSSAIADTYFWNLQAGSGNITDPNVATTTVDGPGTFRLTVTNSTNGCSNFGDVTVNEILTTPGLSVTSPATNELTCNTTSVQVEAATVVAGSTYSWSTLVAGATISDNSVANPFVDRAGDYTVLATHPTTGCTQTSTVTVNSDYQAPTVNIIPDAWTITCSQATINLDASTSANATNFAWSTSNGNIVSGGTTNTAVISQAGTYNLTVTNGVTGCTETGQVIITDDLTPPNVNITGGPYTITCTDPTPTLSATVDVGSSVAWTGPGTITNPTTLNPTVDAAGTYNITATAANGCTSTDNVLVTLDNANPDITVDTNTDDITCTNTLVTVSGSSLTAGVTYLWQMLVGGGNITDNTSATTTVDADGQYELTVTAPNGCTNSDIVTVGENVTPPNIGMAAPSGDLTCNDTTVTLNGSSTTGGALFNWSTLVIGATITDGFSPTPTVDKTGDYTMTVTDPVNGCTSTATTTVTGTFTTPTINIAAAGQITCASPTVTLDATGSANAINYTWTASLGGHIVSDGNTATPTVDAAGRYTVTAEHTTTGCTDSDFVDVTEDSSVPTIDVFDPFPGTITCTNPTVTLSADATGLGVNKTIAWTTSDGNITGGAASSNPTVDQAGTYVVTITNTLNSCAAIRSVTISENTTPPAITIDVPLDLTCSRTQVNLNATGTSVDASPVSYSWVAGAGGNIVSGSTTATCVVDAVADYTVTVIDQGNGCSNTSTVSVAEDITPPDVSVDVNPDEITCTNSTVILNGSSTYPNISYQWTTTGSGTILNSTTTTPIVDAAGTYNLTVENTDNNCTATSVDVIVTENKLTPTVVTNAPSGDITCAVTQVTISVSQNASYNYSWSGPGNITTANSYSTNVDAAGTYTVVVEDINNGCTNNYTIDVSEDKVKDASPIINDIETCFGTANPSFNVISGTNVNWYADVALTTFLASGATYTPTVTTAGTHTYYATSTGTNGCESLPREVIFTIHALPAAPITVGNAICEGSAAEELSAIGTNIRWYDNLNVFIQASTTYTPTDVAAGTYTYYATQTDANSCESAGTATTYTINSIPAPPVFVNPLIEICETETNPIFTVTGSNVNWYKNVAGSVIATGNSHQPNEILPGTYTYYATQTINGCESPDASGDFTINPMPLKYNVSGGGSYCEGGAGRTIGLSGSEADVTYELWLDETTMVSDLVGTGLALDFGNQTAGGSYTIYGYKTATNCRYKMNGGVSVVVDSLPGDAPGISGSTTVCQNETGVNYSVTAISDATNYVWSVPAGFTIVSGNNSNSITVNIDNTAVDGDITVYAQNACGDGLISPISFVTVNPAPDAAGVITGSNSICNDEDGLVYSIAAVNNATSYNWTLPQGATVIAGANSRQITLDFDHTAVDDVISVAAANSCGEGASSSMPITVTNLPYVSAGNQQDLCDDNTVLEANTPAVGLGTWTISNGAANFSGINDPTATLSNIGEGENTLVWTIVANGCTDSDTVKITNNKVFVEAGNNQTICAESITLQGNTVPAEAVGSWSVSTGAANFSDGNAPNAVASGFATGTNILKWSMTKNGCTNYDSVIIDNQRPTQAYAGIDQSICRDTTQLGGNTPSVGTGLWSVVVGAATFVDATDPNTVVRGLSSGDNVLRWTITNGICSTSDEVQITNNKLNVNAGVDQVICDRTTTMEATAPSSGTTYWSVVSGSAAFVNQDLHNTTVTGLDQTTNILTWNVNNNGCISTDTVSITNDSPTTSDAGVDQVITADNTTLQGNNPTIGSGLWTLISGSAIIANDTVPNTNVTSLGIGENTFRWTITHNSCISTDDVVVTNYMSVATDAGPDQTVCGDEATLSGNEPAFGFGEWSVVQGTALFNNNSNPNTTVTGLAKGENILRWSVWENGWTYDDVSIFNDSPTDANAGGQQEICADTTTLAGNDPIIGSGKWTIMSGSGTFANDTVYNTTVSNLANGENIFKWTISNKSCFSSAEVSVTNNLPSTPFAGNDQILCDNQTTLNPNTPSVGTGEWSVISGAGSFSGNDVTDLATGSNTLRWTISTSGCSLYDDVVVVNNEPSDAQAGGDKVLCLDSVNLAANTPVIGTGIWTLQNGSGTIDNDLSPTSKVTDLGVGQNVFRWTISNLGCVKYDEVIVKNSLIVATVGVDQAICSETTVLEANNPESGIGTWTVLGGSGAAIFDNRNQPDTRVSGLDQGVNTLRWTIENDICISYADVQIINNLPTDAFAGPDQGLCDNTTVLQANTPMVGTGEWSILSGSANISNVNSPTSNISNLEYGVNTLRWTISNNGCISTDEVVIANNSSVPASAGVDQTICVDSTFLYGNNPPFGTGQWSVVSGSATFSNNNDYNTKITDLGPGQNILKWEISNGACASSDEVSITNNAPTVAIAGADQTICGDSTQLLGNSPSIGTGQWSLVSGAASFQAATSSNTTVTGLNPGENTIRWTITNNGCTSSDELIITNDLPYVSDAGSDIDVCGSETGLYANDPITGLGQWTVISGSATFTNANQYNTTVTDLGFGSNTLRWTITYDQCITSDEIAVRNNQIEVYAGVDQEIGQSSTLLAANNPSTGSGEWLVIGGSGTFDNPNSSITNVTSLGAGLNTFRWAVTVNGCVSYDDVSVIYNVPPNATFVIDSDAGCPPHNVYFVNNSLVNLPFTWDFGDGTTSNEITVQHTYAEPGSYKASLTVIGDAGEVVTSDTIITVYDQPEASFLVVNREVYIPEEEAQFISTSTDALTYLWEFGDGATSTDQDSRHIYEDEGKYDVTLHIWSEYECYDSVIIRDALEVFNSGEFKFPNAFTPNPDGPSDGQYNENDFSNDVFFPIGEGVDNYHLEIFNKWGVLVFESKDINIGWDGYYNNKLLEEGVYVWKVSGKYNNGKDFQKVGTVMLLR